jgi:hypothetical protein
MPNVLEELGSDIDPKEGIKFLWNACNVLPFRESVMPSTKNNADDSKTSYLWAVSQCYSFD